MKAVVTLVLCLVAFVCLAKDGPQTITKAEMELLIKEIKSADYVTYDSAVRIADNRPGAGFPYKLTYYPNATEVMLDGNRKELWSRYPAHHSEKKGYESDYLDNVTPNLSVFMNRKGTVVFMDTTRTRYMLIHPDGSEHPLPEKSKQMQCLGFVHNRYWVFWERGDYDYDQYDDWGDEYEYSDPENSSGFFDTSCGFLLVNDDGTVYKRVKMKNLGLIPQFSIDPNFKYIAYYWDNYYQNEPTRVWVLADINGKIIRQGASEDSEKKPLSWSEDGKSVLLQDVEKMQILNAANGKSIILLETSIFEYYSNPMPAISNAGTGLILFLWDNKLVLYNYNEKNVKQILKLSDQTPQITELFLSGDGTEFGFNTEKEQRYYRAGKK